MRIECALEFDLRYLLGLLGDRESLADFHIWVDDRCDPSSWNGPEDGVVVLHRENVITARHGDPILGALELRLKREEILIRLEVRVGLGYREQAAERATNGRLVLLELVKRLRVRQDVRWKLHLGSFRARFDYLGQHQLLLVSIALDCLDEVRDKVGAPLILVQHFAPGGFNLLVEGRDLVDAASRKFCEHQPKSHKASKRSKVFQPDQSDSILKLRH